jgi:hypothetical protein
MYHEWPRSSTFWLFLFAIDYDLARVNKEKACPCGGRLHCANYPRKPRGVSDAEAADSLRYRFSFCCAREGCRQRMTPPSVRFLGRRVYVAAVVVLVSAMRHGPSPRRVRELSEHFGADRRTIERWQVYWREHFPQTPFWKVAHGLLPLTGAVGPLPGVLLDVFLRGDDLSRQWGLLLRFLSPITTTGRLANKIS